MPLGGERIGEAYVRIVYSGDGADLSSSLRRDMEKAEPEIEAQGRKSSKAYAKGFEDESKRGGKINFTRLRSSLNEGIGQMEAMGKKASSEFMDSLQKDLERRFGPEIGRTISNNLRDEVRRGLTLEDVGETLRTDLRRYVDQATRQVVAGEQQTKRERLRVLKETLAEAHEMNQAFDRQRLAEQNAMLREANRMNRQFDRDRLTEQNTILAEARRMNQRFDRDRLRAQANMIADARQMDRQWNRDQIEMAQQRDREFERLQTRFNERNRSGVRALLAHSNAMRGSLRTIDDYHDRLGRTTRDNDKFSQSMRNLSDGIGRAFGRGSRNDFVNFFGGMVRGAVRVVTLLPQLGIEMFKFFRGLGDVAQIAVSAFRDASSAGSSTIPALVSAVRTGGAALAISLETAGVAVIGFVAAVAAGILVLGPLIAGLSLLVGALTAVALTLGGGLIGGVAALVALVGPLALGIGAVVVAVTGLSDAQKDLLSNAVKPLTSAFKDMQKAAIAPLLQNAARQARNLVPVLDEIAPVMESASRGMSKFFDGIIDGLRSRGFRNMLRSFDYLLPFALEKLGRVGGNAFEGMAGIIDALNPLLFRFLGWLEDISGRFAEWSATARGQTALKNFFSEVGDAAASLGAFIGGATLMLGDLFNLGGNRAGIGIIDDMTAAIQRFRDYMKENPEAVKQWFADAKRFIESVGRTLDSVIKLLDKFDTPKNRDRIIDFFNGLAIIIGKVADGVAFASALMGTLASTARRIGGKIGDFFGSIGKGGFNQGLIIGKFAGLGPKILKAIGKVDIRGIIIGIPVALARLITPFNPAAGRIIKTIGKVNVAGIIIGVPVAVARLVGGFAGAGAKVLRAIGKTDVKGIIIGAATALSNLISAFGNAGGKVLSAIGHVDVSNIVSGAATAASNLVSEFFGVGGRILDAIGTIVPRISMPHIPGTAVGGLFNGAQLRLIGESGPEAVVPLRRPLAEVDPAVRMLSAIAQGKVPGMASGGVAGAGRTVNAQINVYTPTTDPRGVAVEAINRLVAVGY